MVFRGKDRYDKSMQWIRSLPVHFPKTTLISGVILLIVAGIYGVGIFPKLTSDDNSFNATHTQSTEVADALKKDFGGSSGNSIVLFERKSSNDTVDSPAYKAEVLRLVDTLDPKTSTTYYDSGYKSVVSKDGHDTYAIVTLDGDNTEQAKKLLEFAANTKSDMFTIHVGGTVVGQYESIQQTRHDLELAEMISLPIVALLLLFFFRSVVASLIPLVMAGLTICGALAVAHLIQMVTVIDTYTINVITILGLGLSVDYSLLAVNRFREELALGLHRKEAAIVTAHTAGRTVVFSALTVIVCLLSLLVFPVGFMHSIAIGGAATVLVAMIVSSVLIPALFSLLGHHIDRLHLPVPSSKNPGGIWRHVAAFGVKWPLVTLIAGVLLITAFAIPLARVEPASFTYKMLPNNSQAFYVGKAMDEKFGAKTPSITLLATYDHTPSISEMCHTAQSLQGVKNVDSVMAPYAPSRQLSCEQMSQLERYSMLPAALTDISQKLIHGNAIRIDITPTDDVTAPSTVQLIKDLRARHDDNVTYAVGGTAALSQDALDSYARYAPYALLIIVLTMLIVLTFSLGSVVIPWQAIVINSLGLIIAAGSLVLLYQFGWFQQLFSQTVTGGLNPSMPILVCTIAFGLSMDYAVFLYSRMHEIYDKTGDSNHAILEGVQKTGPIITAAALVFFAVVAAFAMSMISMMQQIGLGLAVAVLVDAFVIRILFVPAVMRLFGKASWYAPKWVKRFVIKHD